MSNTFVILHKPGRAGSVYPENKTLWLKLLKLISVYDSNLILSDSFR